MKFPAIRTAAICATFSFWAVHANAESVVAGKKFQKTGTGETQSIEFLSDWRLIKSESGHESQVCCYSVGETFEDEGVEVWAICRGKLSKYILSEEGDSIRTPSGENLKARLR